MEIQSVNVETSNIFRDGLDPALDTVGVVLDVPVICGECMRPMERMNGDVYSCSQCNSIFRKY